MGLPYSKFFWGDYLKDTRMLSLEAKGAWMDILCHLSQLDEPGEAGYKIQAWARLLGCSKRVARRVIDEIGEAGVGRVRKENEQIFVANSRIKNDFLKFLEKQTQASEAGKLGAEKRHNPLGISESGLASAKKTSSEKSHLSRARPSSSFDWCNIAFPFPQKGSIQRNESFVCYVVST